MKIVMNWDRCESNGMCVRAAPEAFSLDDKEVLTVMETDVPEALHEKVRMAAKRCPKRAITIEE
jgi:ferredoxin